MSDSAHDFDLVVIGSGPAGYRAAVQAAKLGKSVCIVEKNPDALGGAWIHTGTIPSKTLRESMEAIYNIGFHAGTNWVERVIADLSTTKLLGRARKVSQYEEELVRRYFERYQIETIRGFGMIEDRGLVRVLDVHGENRMLRCANVLIATGSRPRRPDDIPFDGWRVVDADEILMLEHLPRTMLIYGAGVIGCEYACIFRALGVDVTLIDGRDKIMQSMDQEVAEALKASMLESGIKLVLGSRLASVKVQGPMAQANLDDGTSYEADLIFFAAGRIPNTNGLGLERLGIELGARGHILVDENFQTKIPGIYAAGDCIGDPALAATSASQGRYAACHMFQAKTRPFPKVFPLGVYTIPELSSVGKTEEELQKEGALYVVGRAYYREVARGYIRGDDHGILKLLVCAKTHKILGIHILGHDACNLIHIGMAFMLKDGHAQDFVDMVFNYPTLAEAFRIAAFNALNKLFPSGEIGDPPAPGQEMPVNVEELEAARRRKKGRA